MNLNHLAIFHAVADVQSVSRGADRLMISQPAVSKQVKVLERALGTVLLDRLPRGVRLTAAGEVLADYARRIFALEGEAERVLGEMAGLRRGRLALAATPTIGVYLLPPVLVKFRRKFPAVEMKMEVHPTGTIERLIADGAIDVGLAESRPASSDVESRVFVTDRLVAIAPRRHPLAARRRVGARDLCREPFVIRETGSGTKSLVERALAERGLGVNPVMSLGSTEAIKRAVMEGVGVAIVSRLAVDAELHAGRLAEIRLADLAIERPLYWLAARGRTASRAVAAFRSLLEQGAESAK
jgi:DNA-binding transcriptional LysR family regulator